MIDHTGLIVTDFEKSKKWYELALAPIGYVKLMEFSKEITKTGAVAGFGESKTQKPDFWVAEATALKPITTHKVHIAFRAANSKEVDDFYQAAIKAGGRDNGAPGPRPHYHAGYYGAFVLDLDGHNIEAVCHSCNQ